MVTSIGFPISLEKNSSRIRLSSGLQRTKEQVVEIIMTKVLDRIMRPTFGNEEYIFTAFNSPAIIAAKIQFSLDNFLPINIESQVEVNSFNNGKLNLTVKYFDRDRGVGNFVTREFQF